MTRGPLTQWYLCAVTLAAVPSALRAQITVRAAAADVDNSLIGGILGAGVFGSVPLGQSGLRLHFGGEYLAGSSSRVGPPCGGFIAPGTCPDEPLRDRATSVSGVVGVRVPVTSTGPTTFYFGGDAGLSALGSRTRGLTSGRKISADEGVWRLDFVGDVEWIPPNSNFGLVGGLALGALAPVGNDIVVDGYTPLKRTVRTLRAWIGVAWRSKRQ